MDKAALRYARWVFLGHIGLLALVVLGVGLAVRMLYGGARLQALGQARQTQELLARQTAQGIQNYYQSVVSLLELIEPEEQGPGARFAAPVWHSVHTRVSALFIVDPSAQMRIVLAVGAEADAPDPAGIVATAHDWIRSVRGTSISPYLRFAWKNGTIGAHLICVPMRGSSAQTIVAFVPCANVEKELLQNVNRSTASGAMLVDQSGVFVSSSEPQVVGHHYTELSNPRTRKLAQKYMSVGGAGTEVFEEPETIANIVLKPSMVTIWPVNVLGQRWYLTIGSDLNQVNAVVKPVFRDALLWASVLVLVMSGILVSTAVQMIRSRLRIERLQHEIVTRELDQAREIQLAWLPHNDDDPPNIDLCAVNQPASHISGDFYNWFQLCDGRTVVVIGDVTGHGMAAAFLMATTQLLVRTAMPRVSSPGECLEEVNHQLSIHVFNGQFVTMQILVLDLENGTLEISTAGHPPPLASDGTSFAALPIAPQLMLGVDPDARFPTERFQLAKGSSLVLYTDGVIDALGPSGERFNIEGIARSLYGRYESAQSIVDSVIAAVNAFRGAQALTDDLTLVAVQLQQAPSEKETLIAAK